MTASFENKVAFVTGGTSGIGRATVEAFAKAGAKVAFTGRRKELGDEIAAAIGESGGTALFLQGDVADESQVASAVAQTVERFGALHHAFNNAGIEGDFVPTHEQSAENARSVFDINVLGVLFSMKAEVPAILQSGGGTIVNNSSILGLRGIQGGSVYNASKYAVTGLTKVAALEYSGQGIRVNSIHPGLIETDMAGRFLGENPAMAEMMLKLHPIGRFGQPKELADAVLWLSSEQSSFISGVSLPVDGGFTAK